MNVRRARHVQNWAGDYFDFEDDMSRHVDDE